MAPKSLPPTHHLPLTTTTHTSRSGVRGAGDRVRDVHPALHGSSPATDWSLPASINLSIPTYTTVPHQPVSPWPTQPALPVLPYHPVHHSQQCSTISTPASDLSVPASTTLKHLDPPAQSCISRTHQPVSPCPSQPHHPVCASQHHPRASIPASITLSLPAVPHCLCQSEMNHFSLEDPPAHPSRMDRPVY